jgi:small-conductance mechanosensitive channel
MIADVRSVLILASVFLGVYLISYLLFKAIAMVVRRISGSPNDLINKRLNTSVRMLMSFIAINIANQYSTYDYVSAYAVNKIIYLMLLASVAITLIKITEFVRDLLYVRFDIKQNNNLTQRKMRTQIEFLQKTISVFVIFIAVAIALMSFARVREMGTSLIASAGIASVIIGFAAQKSIANLLAGFQIAFTQPLRLDDVVIVEGEWGRVEEITLTYVVINIWDSRRLIVPIGYFLEKPFQNWTRTTAEVLGTVFLYADYSLPVDFIRQELRTLLESPEAKKFWDGRVSAVQVTDTTEKSMQVRVLISAANSGNAFELRCLLRERLVAAVAKNYPESFPSFRIADFPKNEKHVEIPAQS